MEITKREVILSISIIAIGLILGIIISGKLSDRAKDKNSIYNKATHIESKELFEYAIRTNIGNAFVYGDLISLDPVTYDEIDGEYMYLKKVKEQYTMHTRTVTTKDSKGKTKTKIETYYTWDEVAAIKKESTKVTFLGLEYDYNKFKLPSAKYIKTIKESSTIRYKYYGIPTKLTGTIFINIKDNNIGNNIIFYESTINDTIEILESEAYIIIFWIVWILLIVVSTYGFYYLDNNWLNR